jgi:4-alpha-glucanotransferase
MGWMTLDPQKPLAGVLAPLFALRGSQDLGIGDVGALREFVDWAAETGFGVVQLLPVNETGNDHSPYNAISSVAIDPTTLEMGAVPDLLEEDFEELAPEVEMQVLRTGPVKYAEVKAVKRRLLRRAFERFSELPRTGERAEGFQEFVRKQRAWLKPYALFRVLMEEHGGSERWDLWPASQQSAQKAGRWMSRQPAGRREALKREIEFVEYIQWVASTQWEGIKRHAEGRGVALMGDVPFGVSYYSADVFGQPELFDHRWSGGAPPEPLFKDDLFTCRWGQNWGVPLYKWDQMRAKNFAWWRQRVRQVRDVFDLFRIDHVLGFYRIFAFPWRPQRNPEFVSLSVEEARELAGGDLPRFHEHDDENPESRAANRAHGEEFLQVLLEETGDYRLVGEDLGTVPEYVRPSLLSLKIPGFRIPFWERKDGRLEWGSEYDLLSVATYATHDHEPLRALWERWMGVIAEALVRPEELGAARDDAWREVRQLGDWAGFEVPCITPFEAVHWRLLGALFRCRSWLAICMITDLFGSTQRFNVPGAVAQSNWSERLSVPVSEWRKDPVLGGYTERLRLLLEETGRASFR